jgi:PRTRC genetic system protein B
MTDRTLEFDVTEAGAAAVTLDQAILVYTGGQSAFATVHKVGRDGAGRPVLLPGKAMTAVALAKLSRRMRKREPGGFIPENVLYRDGSALAWWVPPQTRHVSLRGDADKLGAEERSGPVPNPGLVFAVSASRKWLVWAVKGDERPVPGTALFRAPYFNVWATHAICVGNVELPARIEPERIQAWNDAFFRSWFTHPNDPEKLVAYKGGAYRFWRDLLDGKHATFPEDVLVPANMTLAQAMQRCTGGAA